MLAGAAAPGLEPAVLAGRDRGTPSVAGPDLTARSSLSTDDGRSLSIPTSRKYHMILGPNLPDVVRVVSFSFFLLKPKPKMIFIPPHLALSSMSTMIPLHNV